MKNTPNDSLILRAAIAFLIFVAGIAFMWQLTEPDDATNELHQMKQTLWQRITS